MLSLIYKDFILQKKIIIFAAGYGIFLLIAFNNPIFREFVYNMGTIAISYVMVMTAVTYEEKNKTEIVLNSLPIKRRNIVLEKYIFTFLAVLLAWAIMGGLGALVKMTGLIPVSRFVNHNDLFFSLAGVLLLSSLYFPLYIKFGSKYTRLINLVFFLGLFFLPSWITRFIMENVDRNGGDIQGLIQLITRTPLWMISSLLLAIALAVTLVSFLTSVRIYNSKEF